MKVAAITGGTRGIGLSTAKLFLEKGYKVSICGTKKKSLDHALKELNAFPKENIYALKCDVTKPAQVKTFIDDTIKKFNDLNVLINNAGVAQPLEKLEDTPLKRINSIIDTNIKGVVYGCKYVLPRFKKKRKGTIINISSGAGKHGYADFAVYCASKFAVLGLTQSLSREAKNGINCFAVCPGRTNTKMIRDILGPLGWVGADSPEKVSKIILNACENPQDYENGQAINVS